MIVDVARTDEDVAACFSVMRQLRPALDERTFVADVRRMERGGYCLAFLRDPDVRCVAGYRHLDMFATGLTLYVDDLVTDADHRSCGYGQVMLGWLKAEAARNHCKFLTLDSGLKRIEAHAFYRREGLEEIALHFAIPTDGGPMWTSE